jgi:basic membrane protein A
VFTLVHAVGGASAAPLTGCEITYGPLPLTDRSFNQAVYYGLSDASTKWGVGVQAKVSKTMSQWHRNIDSLVRRPCGLIVTVNSVIEGATVAAAKANPRTRFASTDAANLQPSSNLMSIRFRANQGAFLAGYLAAGLTKTGKVGTFGGIPIGPVTGFMDGFWAGVQHYNQVHGTRVRVLGWNPKTQRGLFIGNGPKDFQAFVDGGAAYDLTTNLITRGADIIIPVDGPVGEDSSCSAVRQARHVLLIGVDTDQFFATPTCQARWLTSVMKVYRRMVYLAMGQVYHGRFNGGTLWGTLKNGGVALAPPHSLASTIPAQLQAELAHVSQEIINRSITTDPRSYFSG